MRDRHALRRVMDPLRPNCHGFEQHIGPTFRQTALNYGKEGRFLARLIEYFGDRLLEEIDQAAIDRAAKILYPQAKPATWARQVHTVMSAVLKHGGEHRRIKRPSQSKVCPPRGLTQAEEDRLILACSDHIRPLVIFLLDVGCRFGEGLRLHWRQVDLVRREVCFPRTAKRDARRVPLNERLVAALERLPHRDGEVFRRPDAKPYQRRHHAGGEVKTAFKSACRRAGISGLTPRDLRDAWALRHLASGCTILRLQELGGWSDPRMIARYKRASTQAA
jgi:integrase